MCRKKKNSESMNIQECKGVTVEEGDFCSCTLELVVFNKYYLCN